MYDSESLNQESEFILLSSRSNQGVAKVSCEQLFWF